MSLPDLVAANQAASPTASDSIAPRSWRSILPIHPAAEMFPLMSPDELREHATDIGENGLQVPIIVQVEKLGDEWSYQLLDGRNRLDALELIGVDPIAPPRSRGRAARRKDGKDCGLDPFLGFPDGEIAIHYIPPPDDAYAFVASLNLHRRHLKPEQKRDSIGKLLKATPEKSNRRIAETLKTSHVTVGAVRTEMESTGQINQLTKTIGKDGKARKQPAKARKTEGKAPAPPRPVKRTRPEEAKRLDVEAGALAAKLVAQLDDETARELHRQLYTTDHRVLWRLTEVLGRKLKVEGFNADEDNDVDPETSAEAMKAEFSRADSSYLDPGPLPESLQRKPKVTDAPEL